MSLAVFTGRVVLACAVLALPGCQSTPSPSEGEADALSASCREADQHSDLDWIQDKVFTPSCSGFSSCHMGAALEAEELNLEQGHTHSQLVGVPSVLFPQFLRVVPGDPEASYLMIAMGQYAGPLGKGGTMPLNNQLVCKEKRDAVERWIAAGALEVPADLDAGTDAPPTPVDGAQDAAPDSTTVVSDDASVDA